MLYVRLDNTVLHAAKVALFFEYFHVALKPCVAKH